MACLENECPWDRDQSRAAAVAGPLEDGIQAYHQEEYATAYRLLRPLAEQGNALAQVNVGILFGAGLSVPQDYAEALKWFRKATDQGQADARFSLGIMYKNGEGVPQDYVQAHMWLNLAASHERMSDAVKERETSPPKWPGAERRGAEAGALNGSQSGSDSFPVQRRPRQRWRSRLQPAQQIPQLDDIRRNAAGRIKAFIHHLYHMLHPLAQHVAI